MLFLTSDPGSSRPQLAARLMENGIGATSAYVMTSAASTARVIGTMEDLPSRRALVVGPRARHAEIQSTGFELVTGDAAREAAVVVVGRSRVT